MENSNISGLVVNNIKYRIYTIRGVQVIIDRDLAEIYNVETRRLNEQVRRNGRLDVANCDRFEALKYSTSLPYVFTEQGVSMLSAVLRSKTAVQISVQIMDAFVDMRKFINNNASVFQRLDIIEKKQYRVDSKLDKVFELIESRELKPKKGIFFDGQVFDAYVFISNLVKQAKNSIVLVDNYIDESTLTLFSKRAKHCIVTIYTNSLSN